MRSAGGVGGQVPGSDKGAGRSHLDRHLHPLQGALHARAQLHPGRRLHRAHPLFVNLMNSASYSIFIETSAPRSIQLHPGKGAIWTYCYLLISWTLPSFAVCPISSSLCSWEEWRMLFHRLGMSRGSQSRFKVDMMGGCCYSKSYRGAGKDAM